MIRCIGYPQSAVLTESRTGTPGMEITFDTDHDEYGTVKMYLWLSDAAWPYSKPKLEHLGFNGDFESPELSPNAVNLSIELEQYEGKPRPRVDLADFGGAKPAGADVAARMRSRWRAETGGSPARPVGRPTSAPPPAAPPSAPPAPSTPPAPAGPMTSEQLGAAIDQVTTKDQAWKLYAESTGGKPDVAAWRQGCNDVAGAAGLLNEGQFQAQHWRQLLGKIIAPF